jgi:hypothetical protein
MLLPGKFSPLFGGKVAGVPYGWAQRWKGHPHSFDTKSLYLTIETLKLVIYTTLNLECAYTQRWIKSGNMN